ncbi:MAG TPA: Rrf2 family transcriptional regulator [Bacilli bacterium]|jgi:Rrf2 family protein|nr:Rrf2 family transcriptional regulator [Bacilli bacterium]HPZ23552.1 Rrf2 family transcriptional regulator [Bacilli bacterium]HQC83390.1 Rrf2 family transcriptional regulator [Bacilli bacterium]
MKVSTRGTYALKAMTYLAKNYDESKFISLNEIAIANNIPIKYLEKIFNILNKHTFFITLRGNEGGYRLARKPEEYKISDILSITEKTVAPVECVKDGTTCTHRNECSTFSFWKGLYDVEKNYLDSKTLKDLM